MVLLGRKIIIKFGFVIFMTGNKMFRYFLCFCVKWYDFEIDNGLKELNLFSAYLLVVI